MGEHVSPAPCLAHDGPAIRGGLEHVYDFRECHPALGPFEPSRDAFTRNRAGDEHDPSHRHAPASGHRPRLSRYERENRHRRRAVQSKATTGRRKRSRIRRSTAARRDSSNAALARRSLNGASSSSASRAELRQCPRIARPRATASSSPSIALNRSRNSRRGSPRSPLASARRASSSRIAESRVGVERTTGAGAKRRQPRDDAIEMRRQRFMPSRLRSSAASGSVPVSRRPGGSRLRDPDRPAPLVEGVEHVGLAELDPHRPATRTLRVVALEVAIDPVAGDLERHSPRGPSEHLLEGGTDDPNQVAVVLAAQIRFDGAAVLGRPALQPPDFPRPDPERPGAHFHNQRAVIVDVLGQPGLPLRLPTPIRRAGPASAPRVCARRRPRARPLPAAARDSAIASAARHSASTRPRSTGRPSSASIDVARAATSGG